MKNSLQTQYNLIQEGKSPKDVFIKTAKQQFPDLIRTSASYEETVNLLKHRNIISESVGGVVGIDVVGKNTENWQKIFEEFLNEDNSKNKKTKDTTLDETQILKGFWVEVKDSKNEGKSFNEIMNIVEKNIKKDSQYYVKNALFGVKGIGMTEEKPIKEPKKGKYFSSGFENAPKIKLQESSQLKENFPNLAQWWDEDPKEIMSYLYWKKGQLPPLSTSPQWKKNWEIIKSRLEKMHPSPKKEELVSKNEIYESKNSKSVVGDRIKEIEKTGSIAALEAKMQALDEEILQREEKISAVKENEALSEFVDESRIKTIQKEIKELQAAKTKYEKLYEKFTAKNSKNKPDSKKEIVDEININPEADEIDSEDLEAAVDYLDKIKDPFDDMDFDPFDNLKNESSETGNTTSTYKQRMINQIKRFKKEGLPMYKLPMKVQDFYKKHKNEIDLKKETIDEININPEADEIDFEDLEASVDYFDNLEEVMNSNMPEMSYEEVKAVAEKLAQALSVVDNGQVTVTPNSIEGASFDLDYNGEKFDGGSYIIDSDGNIKNMAMGGKVYGNVNDDVKTLIQKIKG